MKTLLCSIAFILLCSTVARSQMTDEQAIEKTLNDQSIAWNQGSIDEFMKGYWNNDSLMFIGSSGVTYGYQNTLMNYKKHYSNADKMGALTFELIKIQRLSPEYFYVVGKWHLTRRAGDTGGYYNLLFRKINGKWLIVADHSS